MKTALLLTAAALVFAGCSPTIADRAAEAGGSRADEFADTTNVTVYRNIDNVPNIAVFCVEDVAMWSTLSGGPNESPVAGVWPDPRRCQR